MESQHAKFKLALIQAQLCKDKLRNIAKAKEMIREAVHNGANVVALGEIFFCDYSIDAFKENAEPIDDFKTNEDAHAMRMLSEAAKEHGIYIIGGTIPELTRDKIYNTCAWFNKEGEIVTKHRKMHLFDLEIPGKVKFYESEAFTPGDDFAVFETEYCKFGIGIWYDVRFPDYAQVLCREKGAEVLVYPAAYPIYTGSLHWDILRKTRALDNQVYMVLSSAARPVDDPEMYQTYGHSGIVDPWGKLIADSEHDETIVYADIDINVVYECRQQIPCYSQRRTDLYSLKIIKDSKLP